MRDPAKPWISAALALVAGGLLPLGFAPFHLYPLSVITVAVMFALWLDAPPRRAFRDGYLFGLGLFGVGVTWVFISIHYLGHVSLPLSGLITAVFVAFLALFPATLGVLAARFFKEPDAHKLLLGLPGLWVLFEALRGWIFTGFPWLDLGYSQIDGPLSGLAPVLGVLSVSWATAFSAAVLVAAWRSSGTARAGYATVLALLWGASAGLTQVHWTHPQGMPLKVALLQGAIPQDVRWNVDQRRASVERYLALTRRHWDADLIIWPENALPVFYHEAREFLAELGEEARAHHSHLLIGLPVLDVASGKYYNAMVTLPEPSQFYFKHHLVPFTEYLPLKDVLGALVSFFQVPMSDFSAGRPHQPPLEIAGHRVGISICYEAAFGAEIADPLPQAEFLINVSNDGWFGDSLAPHQHLQIAQMRALETGRYLLRDTNNGISAIIGPRGGVIARSPQFQEYVLRGEAQPMGGATPYVRLGDAPLLLAVSLVTLLGALLAWRRRRSRQGLPMLAAPSHPATPAPPP